MLTAALRKSPSTLMVNRARALQFTPIRNAFYQPPHMSFISKNDKEDSFSNDKTNPLYRFLSTSRPDEKKPAEETLEEWKERKKRNFLLNSRDMPLIPFFLLLNPILGTKL